MAMIQATELENRRMPASAKAARTADLGDGAANHGGRIYRLVPGIAGLILAAAIGGVIFVSGAGQRQPHVAAADNALEVKPHVTGNANMIDGAVEKPAATAEHNDLGTTAVEGKQTT
jgi:hypothetical protein